MTPHEDRLAQHRLAMAGILGDKFNSVQKWLDEHNFFDAPASAKYHGNYPGGLFDHSHLVAVRLVELTEKLDLHWSRPESPYIIGMYHDLCKFDRYIPEFDENGEVKSYRYNDNIELKGHGTKSAILLENLIPLTDEEKDCIIYHMGAFHCKDEIEGIYEGYTDAVKRYPNVLWTHTADMLASQVDGF